MAKRRRYCRSCGNRIHRAAYRCHICGHVTLPWRFYAILAASLTLTYFALKYLHII